MGPAKALVLTVALELACLQLTLIGEAQQTVLAGASAAAEAQTVVLEVPVLERAHFFAAPTVARGLDWREVV